jgi:hypothetical protein
MQVHVNPTLASKPYHITNTPESTSASMFELETRGSVIKKSSVSIFLQQINKGLIHGSVSPETVVDLKRPPEVFYIGHSEVCRLM